ncbi:methyltransferase domain-containing protein [Spirochaeta africana]|uniref:Methyltransferase family protein n=1 Tax=Spirochaeta africana (strain ATCC 700263 / DSM 8902 / Z-7692) TaxID=889378 RepID=H9UJP0_SPIAZ|nr:methyltransferase domain-containing protein [Spirochaeta africana]AFG37733.1 methyltransferase family protein [Spirochaeta africana DSM 8902]
MKKHILCVPEVRPGHGTGHIKRCLELVTAIGSPGSGLYLPHIGSASARLVPEHLRVTTPGERYDLVVIDTRSLGAAEVRRFAEYGPVVGLDARGSGRRYCDYLIDILPHLRPSTPPNLAEPGFLAQPVRVRQDSPQELERILLVFGGEDSLGLSSRMAHLLVRRIGVRPDRVTALIGGAFHAQEFPEGVACVRGVQNAKELFADYDLVITQFGLAMFEAAAAGCAVAGVHPSRYHRRLADTAGFFSLGVRRPALRRLRQMLTQPERYLERLTGYSVGRERSLSRFLLQLQTPAILGSPAGGARCNPGIERTEHETFFRCRSTRLVYKQRYTPISISYDQDYFGEEYRRQYGRTYAEDFDKIKAMGQERLRVLNRLYPEKGSLLDIGCALGPFLQAASDEGWQPCGIDISADAVAWVQQHLNLPAAVGDPLELDFQQLFGCEQFSAVTLWYVIEHIDRLDALLRRISHLLRPGGIFALSTPNGAGVSARTGFRRFLLNGPEDHVTIFEPRHMQTLFGRYGFQVEKIVITGHHPERFPLLGAGRFGRWLASGISRWVGLGDTFELYLRKTGEPLV